jgi:uncharacterized protein YhdP
VHIPDEKPERKKLPVRFFLPTIIRSESNQLGVLTCFCHIITSQIRRQRKETSIPIDGQAISEHNATKNNNFTVANLNRTLLAASLVIKYRLTHSNNLTALRRSRVFMVSWLGEMKTNIQQPSFID